MDNSGSAFPVPVSGAMGLTKRELAAMVAMAGMLANSGIIDNLSRTPAIAEAAVAHADALLAELAKGGDRE